MRDVRYLDNGVQKHEIRLFSSDAFFFYVRLRTYAQCASMNEFTCSEHSVRIRRSKRRSTGNYPFRNCARGLVIATLTIHHGTVLGAGFFVCVP